MGKTIATLGLGISLLATHAAFANDTKTTIIGVQDATSKEIFTELSKKQNNDKTATMKKAQRKKASINYEPSDSINHQEFINMDISKIIDKYGQVKGLKLIRDHFLTEINNQRAKLGHKPLKLNTIINELAQAQAQDMAANQQYGHSNAKGETASSRMEDDGRYNYENYLSNISGNVKTINGIVQGYINQNKLGSHHYDIIQLSYLEDMGIGFAKGKNGVWYSVVNYGNELHSK